MDSTAVVSYGLPSTECVEVEIVDIIAVGQALWWRKTDNLSTKWRTCCTGFFSTLRHWRGWPRKHTHLNAGTVKYYNKHSIHMIFAASLTKIMD